MGNILSFNDVSYHYLQANKKNHILSHVNYTFETGKLYTIVGPSGSGKTTTLSLAGALDTPKGGEIIYEDKKIKEIGDCQYRSHMVGMVFQSFNLIKYMSALQNVQMAMEISKKKLPNRKQTAVQLLEKLGLSRDEIHRNINQLSGGQQQRVAIARAISTDAKIILADEPTGNLDAETAKDIMGIFLDLAHNDEKCVIVVTHSVQFAEQADIILKLKSGQLTQYIKKN